LQLSLLISAHLIQTVVHNLDMGNQLSMVDDSACPGTAHQHDTIALEDAVDSLRRMPHLQQGSLMLQYANKTHQAVQLKLKTDAPLPCRYGAVLLLHCRSIVLTSGYISG
jgi:hypothetical protein